MTGEYPVARKPEMTDIKRFKAIFEGLDIAYGTYRIEKARGDGKQAGKAVVVRQPPVDELWEKHLEGVEPSLGIIPIRADNSCIWGCIDIDQYPLDHRSVVEKIKALNLPLVVCRSKSGGAHVFAFTKEPIPAADMRQYLTACAALLGESGREIFPKQSEILVDRGDTGNFLNLPYFGGDETLRYGIKSDGTAATLEEFYRLYDDAVQDQLVAPEAPAKPEQPIKDGPPCLQTLCSQGFPEGTRNNGLFNIGIYLKRTGAHNWEDKLAEHNQKYFGPPLGLSELQVIVKQLTKKDYKYKCKDAPINSFCNAGLCRTRKFGVGADGPDAPQMSALSKYNSEPPLWFLDINGRRVELDTESLYNQAAFQKACMDKINLLPPTLRKQDWEQVLNALLREMVELEQIQEASEDTTITGRFTALLEEFTTHIQQAMDRDEILMGRPWVDEEDQKVYFRIKDLEDHLTRNNFKGLSAPKMAQRLRDLGGEPLPVFLKGRTTRVWRIPCFPKQEAPFETPTMKKGSPF
jgi:hypothetical protein